MFDWLHFFDVTIAKIQKPLAIVLDARGCREGWLQGEIFRAGRKLGLRVNDHPLGDRATADLSCGDPATMVTELKIVGALDNTKMQGFVERDVERMLKQKRCGLDAYMILVVPDREGSGKLAEFLKSCSFSQNSINRKYPGFRVQVWRL